MSEKLTKKEFEDIVNCSRNSKSSGTVYTNIQLIKYGEELDEKVYNIIVDIH